MLRSLLVFLVLALTIGVTVGEQLLSAFGLDTHYLLIALIAIASAGMLMYRHILLVVLVGALVLAINLPAETLARNGVDRDLLLAALVALIVIPTVMKLLGRE